MSSPSLRRATADDVLLYFEWANDHDVRRNSFTQRPISLEDHIVWFRQKLASSSALMLVMEADGQPIGQIRFDSKGDVATIGFALTASARGRGLGKRLLRDGLSELRATWPHIRIARGRVREENRASRGAFEAVGFQRISDVDDTPAEVVYEIDVAPVVTR